MTYFIFQFWGRGGVKKGSTVNCYHFFLIALIVYSFYMYSILNEKENLDVV